MVMYMVRNKQVMVDSDLAMLYQVETKALNRAVKRNAKRFPEDFCFQLTAEELKILRCQSGTAKLKEAETDQKIFFDGQIYDAFRLLAELIQKAEKEIILVDGYVDIATLNLLAKKKKDVTVTLYTLPGTKLSQTDIANFNAQYSGLELKFTKAFHDRFLILDNIKAYHVGASLKDAGKKCFGINLIQDADIVSNILQRLDITGKIYP